MKTKSLAANNRYLKRSNSGAMMARNLASSTSIETGKSSTTYVERYTTRQANKVAASHSPEPAVTKMTKSPKRSVS